MSDAAISDAAIIVEGVHKRFGDIDALVGVNLQAPAGKVFGLLGPNGAGKTTLVRILTTLLQPDSGYAEVAGFDVVHQAAPLRRVIGLAGQYAAVDENLTGRENLTMVGQLYHLGRREARRRADETLERLSLTDAADRVVKTYSGGMRRRLDLGASFASRPQVLFLDEPTTGLDPRTRKELWHIIRELVAGGTTLLLTTQYLEEADQLADRIAVIDHGRVIAEGTTQDLKSQLGSEVIDVRLGDISLLEQAANLLSDVGNEPPHRNEDTGELHLSVQDGSSQLVEIVRRFDRDNIAIAELSLRRPTLDEVFLSLTGDSDMPNNQDSAHQNSANQNSAHQNSANQDSRKDVA